jgi:hypothetical protein
MSTVNTKITRNQLDMPKSFRLGKWLASQVSMPNFAKSNQLALSQLATKELGFEVTDINLRTVAKAAEIDLPSSRTGVPRRLKKGNVKWQRNLSRQRINILRDCLVDIYRQFGQDVPPELQWKENQTEETEGESKQ